MLTAMPVKLYAGSIEGTNTDEKSMMAGYDLYETIAILVDEYVGEKITVEQLYEAALRGIAEELDEYSFAMTEEEYKGFEDSISGNYEGLGIILNSYNLDFTYVKEVLPDSPAEKAGVMAGDAVITVNGTDVTKMDSSEISDIIMASAAKSIKLTLMRDGADLSFTIDKAPVHMSTVQTYKLDVFFPEAKGRDNIRLVALTSFGEKTYDEFKAALDKLSKEKVEYIILDLRDNSGGYLAAVEKIAKLIVPEGPIYHIKTNDGKSYTASSALSKLPFKHIVVLTNYYTASASELLASALQDSKAATVIGQKTFGKGVVQDVMPTVTGGVFKFTSAEYLRRNNTKVNKIGVSPDVLIDKPHYIDNYAASEEESGKVISDVKKLMAYIGCKVDNSAAYNESIKKEIIKFQNERSLSPTGFPDKLTVIALNTALYEKLTEENSGMQEIKAAFEYINENYIK